MSFETITRKLLDSVKREIKKEEQKVYQKLREE